MKAIPDQLIQEINQTDTKAEPDLSENWPPNFFEEVIGGWEGEKLTREPQPDYPIREAFKG